MRAARAEAAHARRRMLPKCVRGARARGRLTQSRPRGRNELWVHLFGRPRNETRYEQLGGYSSAALLGAFRGGEIGTVHFTLKTGPPRARAFYKRRGITASFCLLGSRVRVMFFTGCMRIYSTGDLLSGTITCVCNCPASSHMGRAPVGTSWVVVAGVLTGVDCIPLKLLRVTE